MASTDDIKRITRRSEALKSLSLGEAPLLEPSAFARFPEMVAEMKLFNEKQRKSYERLKNLLAEALLGSHIPP